MCLEGGIAATAGHSESTHSRQQVTTGLPRTPFYASEHLLPQLRRHTWFRLVRLTAARAAQTTEAAPDTDEAARLWNRALASTAVQQMVQTLGSSGAVTDRGDVDVSYLVSLYALRWDVTTRTAWRHWDVMRRQGLVHQRQAPAPGQKALYVLTFPPARLPAGLPASGRSADLDSLVASWDGHAAQELADLDGLEVVAYGSAASPPSAPDSDGQEEFSLGRDLCQTSPLYARGTNPSPSTAARRRTAGPSRARSRGGISSEERAQAGAVLDRCRPRWAAQLPHVPTAADLAELVGMVAVARRYTTEGDLVELLGQQVASSRDLVGLLRWRLQRLLNNARRRARLAADDDGTRYQADARQRAQVVRDLHQQTSTVRAQARAAADAARARIRQAAEDAARREAERRAEKRRLLGLSSPLPPSQESPGRDGHPGGQECVCASCRVSATPVDVEQSADLRWLATQRRPVDHRKPHPVQAGDDAGQFLASLASWSHPSQQTRPRR